MSNENVLPPFEEPASQHEDEDDDEVSDNTCPNCYGDGMDPYSDHCLPCVFCGGAGIL